MKRNKKQHCPRYVYIDVRRKNNLRIFLLYYRYQSETTGNTCPSVYMPIEKLLIYIRCLFNTLQTEQYVSRITLTSIAMKCATFGRWAVVL